MKKTTPVILFFFLLIAVPIQAGNPEPDRNDTLARRMERQRELFPQEKIYLQTDKTYYISGEKIWFGAYIADGSTHVPVTDSRYIYVELIDPPGSVVKRIKIRQTDSLYYGHLTIPEDLPQGEYAIRAYTYYLYTSQNDFFFRKNIYIGNPYLQNQHTEVTFDESNDNGQPLLTATIRLMDQDSRTSIKPDLVTLLYGEKVLKYTWNRHDSTFTVQFHPDYENKLQSLFLKTDGLQQYIPLPQPKNFDVSFFPEGGYLLTGAPCRIGFKALKTNGLAENITGDLFDAEGNKITSFQSIHKGMGYFHLLPEAGKTYYALCRNNNGLEKKISLPEAKSGMYGIQARWDKNRLLVSVQKSSDLSGSDSLILLIHCRGILQYISDWDPGREYLTLDKNIFPSGVSHLLLLNKNRSPLSERLIFCRNDDQARVDLSTDREEYSTRDHIITNVNLTDKTGQPVTGQFSVAVTDDNDTPPDTCTSILSHLLLASELKGYIESPEYYFRADSAETRNALEALLLTQGWRRYNVPETLQSRFVSTPGVKEIGQEICGRVTRAGLIRNRPAKDALVTLLSLRPLYTAVTWTDNKGYFCLDGFDFPDSTKLVIKAVDDSWDERVELKIEKETFSIPSLPVYPSLQTAFSGNPGQETLLGHYINKAGQKYTMENGMRMIHLNEIVISKHRKKAVHLPSPRDKTLTADDIESAGVNSITDLLRRIAGVEISANGKIHIRGTTSLYGSNSPMLVINKVPIVTSDFVSSVLKSEMNALRNSRLNKMPVGNSTSGSFQANNMRSFTNDGGNELGNMLEQINIQDVKEITIIKGQSSIYGLNSAGVIAITTKTGNLSSSGTPDLNIQRITPLGYQKPAEFYSPKYETPLQKAHTKPDLRSTIYWEPPVRTGPSGTTDFDFYASDYRTTYTLIIEGITDNGKIIYGTKKIKVTSESPYR